MKVHPSKDIVGTEGNELVDKRIVLCVTGSVAAVYAPEIARQLMRHGAEVFVVMSPMAQKIVHPYLMEWATGNEVVVELTGKIEHVALANEADLILIAPATANTISKIACGIDDTPVTSVVSAAFGLKIPILIVPAMHESMYRHPILIENIEKLKSLGVKFVAPRIEEGKAKIAEISDVVKAVIETLRPSPDLKGFKILVTAGATMEHIDPVRVITNPSSGKMGIAIAEEAARCGAEVTLIMGVTTVNPPPNVRVIRVKTTEQMLDAVMAELQSRRYDVMFAAAAPADWTPVSPASQKISTSDRKILKIELKPTPKIIDKVKEVSPQTLLVAFRAVYGLSEPELVEDAYQRLMRAKADLIVVNDVSKPGVGFGAETNEVFIIDRDKRVLHIDLTSKHTIAKNLLSLISNLKAHF
ncbi:MAG: bifunctional phosphopantothenoylcysteine decarboxylase/phosphopantothenate--cysteine ligase CoaBC [Candidatus Hydrothermota bacterium]|nr:MAG: bifunctional phosphopantothenoylcysteine decarboxylase/phosphopantothenate--cysteine ligase CoaBC [Candidatus Hydrothermae bacterium]